MDISGIVFTAIFSINILLIVLMIFVERKKPEIIVAWVMIFVFLPVVGFALYMLFGGGLSIRTRLLIKNKKLYTADYLDFIKWQEISFANLKMEYDRFNDCRNLIHYVRSSSESLFSTSNNAEVFLNGPSKIASLKQDLKNAKHSINIEYYIFAGDSTGKEIMNILCKKAKEGVKVKLIYDSIGCLGTPRRFFRKLKHAGGEVAEFFPPLFGIRLINLKINFRNHRKIVVIDGNIAWTGGINIRDDHMGKTKKLSPWRDTHVRLTGKVVWDVQNVFFNDWRYCTKDKVDARTLVEQGYFDPNLLNHQGTIGAQVITSGPETEQRVIEDAFIRMISMAKEKIYIQSPYFVTDDNFVKSLIIAKRTGVDVKIMLPSKPDKKFVYLATMSYVKQLLEEGIEIYIYNGFIHAKTLLVDDMVTSIGTCNTDNRSFALNFEITTLLYSKEFAIQNQNIFKNDIKNSKVMTLSYYNKKPFYSKLLQAIFRLLSPIL